MNKFKDKSTASFFLSGVKTESIETTSGVDPVTGMIKKATLLKLVYSLTEDISLSRDSDYATEPPYSDPLVLSLFSLQDCETFQPPKGIWCKGASFVKYSDTWNIWDLCGYDPNDDKKSQLPSSGRVVISMKLSDKNGENYIGEIGGNDLIDKMAAKVEAEKVALSRLARPKPKTAEPAPALAAPARPGKK